MDQGRGSLPYALIHGEALVACAAWALGEAGLRMYDASVPWDEITAQDAPVVLHDALCPMTPPDFISTCVERSLSDDAVVVGTRPVTDTVAVVEGDRLGATVDRDGLLGLVSPVVLPARAVRALAGPPGSDLVALVSRLSRTEQVIALSAPATARRVSSTEDLALLEALSAG